MQLFAGGSTSCARLVDGSVWCWGARGIMLVDNDVIGDVACPVATRIPELSPASYVLGNCIVRPDGATRCGDTKSWRFAPEKPGDARELFYWGDDRCAITKSGTIQCENNAHAAEAASFTGVEKVAFLDGQFCALSKGTVTCSIDGALVVLAARIASIASGARWLWAVRDDGTLVNLEACGRTKHCEYTQNLTRGPVVEVAVEGPHTCILARDGHVWCERKCGIMGCKESGFVEIAGVDDATKVVASSEHACALHEDGTVTCWGESYCGQAGGTVEAGKRCSGRTTVPPTTIQWAK